MRRKQLLCAALGWAFALGAGGALPQAQAPAPGLPTQQQGFEGTGQNPANYTPEEKAAVEVIIKWIDTTNTKDLSAHMALVDDNVIYRADPAEILGRNGARGYCLYYGFIRSTAWLRLDELYVIGGPTDTLVLVKRADINNPAGGRGNLGGYPVALADLVRIRNGKIVEWYDIPINKVGPLVTTPPNSRPPITNMPTACMPYAAGQESAQVTIVPPPAVQPQPHPVTQTVLGNGMVSYGTTKLESRFNVEEAAAARAVRGWFSAWQAGNPKLLGSFVDRNAIFRASPTGDVINGRDPLLRAACSTMGGPLDLIDIYVIGADFETTVIARWNKTGVSGAATKMGSFFRVQNGLITEWMDSAVDGTPAVPNPNSAACQTVTATLATFAPLPARPAP
jgi:hypothetical protein